MAGCASGGTGDADVMVWAPLGAKGRLMRAKEEYGRQPELADVPEPTCPPTGVDILACAHGTIDLRGRAAVGALVAEARRLGGGTRVRAAYVDVQPPTPVRALERYPGPVVLVPLLLSRGYHVRVDVTGAARERPGAGVAPPLGAGDEVVQVLALRLTEAAGAPRAGDRVVLAAVGSSDPRVCAEIEGVAEALSERTGWDVAPAYLRVATPRLGETIAAARRDPGTRRVVVATYLLAPGVLADKVASCGADVVGAPLLASRPDEATRILAAAVLARAAASASTGASASERER